MPRKSATQKISNEAIAQYLTADLGSMTQRAIQYENLLANKINFYLVLVTAAIGGLLFVANVPEIKPLLIPIACLVLLILSIMGVVTLFQGLDLSASTTFMFRRMGRIRQWFLDQDPNLFPYLPFMPGDDKPTYYVEYARLRSTEAILLIVNAVLIAMLGALLWIFIGMQVLRLSFNFSAMPYLIALGIGTLLFICAWWFEFNYAQNFMKNREKKAKEDGYINFPSAEILGRIEKKN